MYFSLWKTPGVSERMWSVNLEASISGESQTLGGHSSRPSEQLGSLMTGTRVTGSDCDKLGNTSERRREHWVHLEVSPNQCRNHKQTLRDAWVCIDIHWEDCRRYLRLSGCPQAIDFPQRRI